MNSTKTKNKMGRGQKRYFHKYEIQISTLQIQIANKHIINHYGMQIKAQDICIPIKTA